MYAKKTKIKKFFFISFIISIALLLIAFASVYLYFYFQAKKYDLNMVGKMPERTQIFDYKGRKLGSLHGQNRIVINFNEIPKNFINALIAREDSRFFNHGGVDIKGVIRAAIKNMKLGTAKEGASTITMQLARNSYSKFEKTLYRKILETFIAFRIEKNFSKEEILTFYTNRIYFGFGTYGLEAGARACFNKNAKNLDLSECATLAGIIRSPNNLSPIKSNKKATSARNTVLKRMQKIGFISEGQYDKTLKERVYTTYYEKKQQKNNYNYAFDAIRRELQVFLSEDDREEGGLKIYTTIDANLQKSAENSLENHLKKIEQKSNYTHQKKSEFNKNKQENPQYIQGATVVIDNQTGAIRALVGGRDYKDSPFNRAIQAKRQIGSVFKPFVYTSAYNAGLLPGRLVDDNPIKEFELSQSFPNMYPKYWSPKNSDGKYNGYKASEFGLIKSRNTMTVRIGEYAGFENIKNIADRLNISKNLSDSPTVYLGAFESTVKNIASAYTIFPNNGTKMRPFIIKEIVDNNDDVMFKASILPDNVFEPESTWMTHRALKRVFEKGTAYSAKKLGLDFPAGGKTGTTDKYRDAWFVGYTSSLTCAVWVGMDTLQKTIDRGYGSTLALPIWVNIMKKSAEIGYPVKSIANEIAFRPAQLCRISDLLANKICRQSATAYTDTIPSKAIPQNYCSKEIHIQQGILKPRKKDQTYRARTPKPNALDRFFNIFR